MCWLTVDRLRVLLALLTFLAICLARPEGTRHLAAEPSASGHTPLYEVYDRIHREYGNKEAPSTEDRQNKAASPAIRESIKAVTNQLLESNVTLDTRTPPKVKSQMQLTDIKVETSHAGVAIPVDSEDDLHLLEEQAKKVLHKSSNNNIYNYKVTPSTNNGLSTWILLSGQPSTTNKPSSDKHNKTVTRLHEKIRTTTVNSKKVTPLTTTTQRIEDIQIGNSTSKTITELKEHRKVATIKPIASPSTVKIIKVTRTTTAKPTTTEVVNTTTLSNEIMAIEAKDGDSDIPDKKTSVSTTTTKKPGKNTSSSTVAPKRKRNKNKKRKPAVSEKTVNGTKPAKVANKNKEKPISTQIYNYLSREIMPTVGVGFLGLMVTAGLASYFLYPFTGAPVRRAYEADRKEDKYYYNDDYATGGQAEEDVISKVMAGMPQSSNSNSYQDFTYPNPVQKQQPDNTRYQSSVSDSYSKYKTNVNTNEINNYQQPSYGNSDNIYNNHAYNKPVDSSSSFNRKKLNEYGSQDYKQDVVTEHSKEIGYTVSSSLGRNQAGNSGNQQVFVVGNVPKEAVVTPAAVPEHGPRNMRIRRRKRDLEMKPETISRSVEDNEISDDDDHHVLRITTAKGENVVPLKLSTRFKSADLFKISTESVQTTQAATTTESAPTTTSNTVIVYPVGQKQPDTLSKTDEQSTEKETSETTLRTTYTLDNKNDKDDHKTPNDIQSNEVNKPSSQDNSYIQDSHYHDSNEAEHYSFFKFVRNLIEIKLRLGLAVMQHTAEAIQRYVHEFQRRMNYTIEHHHHTAHDYNYTMKPVKSQMIKKLY